MTDITEDDRRQAEALFEGDDPATIVRNIVQAIAETRERVEAPLRDKLGHVRVQRNEHQAHIVELETELCEMRRRNEHWRQQVGKKESRIFTLSDRLDEDRAHNRQLRVVNNMLRGKIIKLEGVIHAKNADLSDLAQERDRLRGALTAPGPYPPTDATDRKPTL